MYRIETSFPRNYYGLLLISGKWRNYRSFKKFNVENFNIELSSKLSQIDFSEGRDINDMYEEFTRAVTTVTDKYAPQKMKKNVSLNLSLI